ncbi:ABC transporter ATP-binding protein [Bacillus massiliigorillae]|uniref:ABC transporter ATP-binding protein n=1 Tax=Bacillus massiliigorillae TaxID=1243664 RepID=UPI0003A5F009|nr:ABC transporter ATP-binding protein [Bacillus massiliigorillae]
MDAIVNVENISKDYGNFKLQNVSFQVPKGSIMGFIGENGAGKTTTLKMILNLIKKDSGNITLFGMDHIKHEKQIKEDIAVVFEESYFYNELTTKDIAKLMRKVFHNWDDPLFNSYLMKFNLPSHKMIKEFSKGMKMKLSIATALSHHPKILILDEATSGLDPVIRNEILDVFLDFIQDEEHSIILSSHITTDLEKIADYITFINDGKIIFSKSKDELIYEYGVLKCGIHDFQNIDSSDIIGYRKSEFGYEILVQNRKAIALKYPNFIIDSANIEDIMLYYVRGEKQ